MRIHHAIAVAAIVILGLGAKLIFFPPHEAEATIIPGINVLEIQNNHPNLRNMPTQEIHDRTFVFTSGE